MLYTLKYLRFFLEEKTDGQICYNKKLLTSKHKRREVIDTSSSKNGEHLNSDVNDRDVKIFDSYDRP